MAKEDNRFVITYSQGGTFTLTQIWVDKQTGVNYLFTQSGNAGGLTPLLDREGRPIVTPVPRNYSE